MLFSTFAEIMDIGRGVTIKFPSNPGELVGYGNETSYTVDSKVSAGLCVYLNDVILIKKKKIT